MPEYVTLACPNPECPEREVEGQSVSRFTWDSRWLGQTSDAPGEPAMPECPVCGASGVPDDDKAQLEAAEEEHGVRCPECGVVTAHPDGGCPHCGEKLPNQKES